MQLLWVDDSFPPKDKTNNYQLDSSRTTDSFSYLYNPDEVPQKEENENKDFPSFHEKNKLKDEENKNLIDNLKEKKINNQNIISFKKYLSIFLCVIYCILFLINSPKIPVKIGEEDNIDTLIKNNSTKRIDILINHLMFLNQTENYKTTGFLLEFSINKIYLFRWLIGFSYFIIKCICFVYSNNENNNNSSYFLDKSKINIIQKISMLFFPICIFYYDFKNNVSYSELKVEKIDNKEIAFYVMTKKSFSMIDYIEGLIPTLFYFLISIDYDNLNKTINTFLLRKSKLNKLV